MKFINRNVTVVIIILVFVVIAGYLVWVKSNYDKVAPMSEPSVKTELMQSSGSANIASDSGWSASESTKESVESSKGAERAN